MSVKWFEKEGAGRHYGKPDNVNVVDLEQQTAQSRREVAEMPSMEQYEKESHLTPRWKCAKCGRDNECAVSSCNECGHLRPAIIHGDPFQHEAFYGFARRIARRKPNEKRISLEDPKIKNEVENYIREWDAHNPGYKIEDYRFDKTHNETPIWVGWKEYVKFLLKGGRV